MGHNKLTSVVKTLCEAVGIDGHMTNHSLRATCATRLYNNNVAEQVIMERTGHRSTKGVRVYKRTNDVLVQDASVIIDRKSINQGVLNSTYNNKSEIHFHISECNVTINN